MATKSFCFFRSIPTPSHLSVLGIDAPQVEHVVMSPEELAVLPELSLQVLSSLVGVGNADNYTASPAEAKQLPSMFDHVLIRLAPRDIHITNYHNGEWWPNATYGGTQPNWLVVMYSVIPGDMELDPVQFLSSLGAQTVSAVAAARTWYEDMSARYTQYQTDIRVNRIERIAHLFGAKDAEALAYSSNAPFVAGPHGVLFSMSWEDFESFRSDVALRAASEAERIATERAAAKAARDAFVTRLLSHIGNDEMRARHARGLLPQKDLIGEALLPAAFEPRLLVYDFASDTGRATTLSAKEFALFTDAENKLRGVCGLVHVTAVTPVLMSAERCDEVYARISMQDATGDSDWHRTVYVYLTSRSDD